MIRFVEFGLAVSIINNFVPHPDSLVGVPVSGFPKLRYDIAIHPELANEGAVWLRELLLGF